MGHIKNWLSFARAQMPSLNDPANIFAVCSNQLLSSGGVFGGEQVSARKCFFIGVWPIWGASSTNCPRRIVSFRLGDLPYHLVRWPQFPPSFWRTNPAEHVRPQYNKSLSIQQGQALLLREFDQSQDGHVVSLCLMHASMSGWVVELNHCGTTIQQWSSRTWEKPREWGGGSAACASWNAGLAESQLHPLIGSAVQHVSWTLLPGIEVCPFVSLLGDGLVVLADRISHNTWRASHLNDSASGTEE